MPSVPHPVGHVCATCREPLSYYVTIDSGRGSHGEWRHGHPVDHPADPVPRVETTTVAILCDFCCQPPQGISYWYPTDGFVGRADAMLVSDEGDGWGACGTCSTLIEAGNYDALVNRCASILARRNHVLTEQFDMYRENVRLVYATFRRARTGPRRPVDPHTGTPV